METEEVDFQFAARASEKKSLTMQEFERPQRNCKFCGRVTKHSDDERICLVCGMVKESQ